MDTEPARPTNEPRTTPLGMLRYSIEFYAAAIATDDSLGGMRGHDVIAPITVNYLMGHAIELALKSYLLQRERSLDDIKRIGHHLVRAFDEARALGLDNAFRADESGMCALQVLDALYSTKQFEYIETGAKHFPVFGPLQAFAQRLIIAVAKVVPQGEGFLRDNHKPGLILVRGLADDRG